MDKLEAATLLIKVRNKLKEKQKQLADNPDDLAASEGFDMALQMAIHCLIESQLASINGMFSALLEKGDQNDTTA